MALSIQDVERVALLARLQLTDEELHTMTRQLQTILRYIDQLAELNTDNVPPLAHAVDVANVFRADEVCPSLDRAAALANAPHTDGECYLVPAVLGE
jgi:aspartyl-tRNA(Asn)/glutamyl-tRNA(Gln) amidotransferase subunit C